MSKYDIRDLDPIIVSNDLMVVVEMCGSERAGDGWCWNKCRVRGQSYRLITSITGFGSAQPGRLKVRVRDLLNIVEY